MNLITAQTCAGLHVGLMLKDCKVLSKTLIFMLLFHNIFCHRNYEVNLK
jgi:hypothetical protein